MQHLTNMLPRKSRFTSHSKLVPNGHSDASVRYLFYAIVPDMSSDVNARSGSISSRTVIGAGWLVAWRMVTRALGLVSTLVLARILIPADFGLIAMATSFSSSVGALSELGVSEALVRRQENERGHYDTAFTMQAIRGALTGAVIAAGAWVASNWFHEPRLLPVMFVLAALAITSGFENIGIVEFRRSLRFDMEFRLLFLPRIVGFCTTIAMAWLLRSFWALLIGITAGQLMRVVMTYVVHPYRPCLTLSHWRDLVGFSFWTWATSLAVLVWDRLDTFVLGPVLGPAKLGVYMIAAEIATMPITELVAPASSALFPGLSAAQQRGTNPIGLAFSVTSTMLLIVVPLTIGVSATSGYVVAALLGPNWEAAQPLIAIFVWLCLMSPFSWVCMIVLRATGAVRQHFVAIAAAAAFKIVILYGVVQTGARLEVAAAAVVVCSAVECGLFLRQLRKVGDTRWRESLGGLLRITASGAFATGVLVASGLGWQSVSMTSVPALLVGGAIGLVTIVLFVAAQLALWWGSGRPEGPEHRMLGLVTEALTSLKSR
jgi:lipopolysaccharide exporter